MLHSESSLNQLEDYQRIADAIAFIQAQQQQQPDLAAIAKHVHLSEYHFHRLFARWAGVSPKRFLQLLTVEYSKQRLQETHSLLRLSLEAGLSSSSRLHDWFVRLEAMTPAEYRDQGKNLVIAYGIHPTLFGMALIATTERGVCNLQFLNPDEIDAAVTWLQEQWPLAMLRPDTARTQPISDRLNQAMLTPTNKPLPLLVKGTNFQIQVWRALINLPFGSLATYQDIAIAMGNPQAARAVGTAIGANPVAYLIPCHRVIRRTGHLGGYRWGCLRKSTILSWEASQLQEGRSETTTDG